MFCCTLLYVHSDVAIILMGMRELVALLNLSCWCLVVVERLFLAVPLCCLWFVIVVFPDHTHILFLKSFNKAAYAVGPRRNLRIQWESFLLLCFILNWPFLPTSTETLQLYAQFLNRYFKSVQSICNYISGVKTIHLLLGFPSEHINKFILNLSLKGIAKLNTHWIRQAEVMTPAILFLKFRWFFIFLLLWMGFTGVCFCLHFSY